MYLVIIDPVPSAKNLSLSLYELFYWVGIWTSMGTTVWGIVDDLLVEPAATQYSLMQLRGDV